MIRGIFLGSGSINNPENKYHLEITFKQEKNLSEIGDILKKLGINSKSMKIKNKYSIYLKEGEEISKFLALIGANKAVMQFEDIRIQREMRGKVNRLVNCETANLNKTINASIEQIAAIRKLQETGKFNKLNDNLKEIALLRLENPDIALSDLGKLLKEPVGKSGVNYRLKKIIDIANE
ncbi:MAG: DNA-binding protein WhiA [Clostridia bacterium]|nr:DNA-binding protein WhiA [Clostridia bacterium]